MAAPRRIWAFGPACSVPHCKRPATFTSPEKLCCFHWRVWWDIGEKVEYWTPRMTSEFEAPA